MLNKYNKFIKMEDVNFMCDYAYVPDNLYENKSNIYYHDGINYISKHIYFEEEIINELIGSYLSKLIGLESVDYKVGFYNDSLYALSELFYDDNYDYEYVKQIYFSEDINNLKKKLFKDDIPEQFPYIRDKIIKLALLDIKMCQCDRCSNTNIMIKKSKVSNYTDLAPIYDFSDSYPKSFADEQLIIYYNTYLTLRKNKESLLLFLKKYPQAKDTLYKLANLDMKNILSDIENQQEIIIDESIKEYLVKQDNKNSMVLKKIL